MDFELFPLASRHAIYLEDAKLGIVARSPPNSNTADQSDKWTTELCHSAPKKATKPGTKRSNFVRV